MEHFDDGQYYAFPPMPGFPHLPGAWHLGEEHPVIPVISLVGSGPKGDPGQDAQMQFGRPGEQSALWDNSAPYDKGTFVINGDNIYVAVSDVPAGADIHDQQYWREFSAGTADVSELINRINSLTQALEAEQTARANADSTLSGQISAEETARSSADTTLNGRIADEVQARTTGDSTNAAAINTEKNNRIAADNNLQTQINNRYTKAESDELYVKKTYSADDVLVCFGDGYLTGYSQENPSGITAWDYYLGKSLGFATNNIFKESDISSGFLVGTPTFQQMIPTIVTKLTNANKSANDVKLIAVGGGAMDLRQIYDGRADPAGAFGNAVAAMVQSLEQTFPNAVIHIFPIMLGCFGYSGRVTSMESEAALAVARQEAERGDIVKAFVHKNVWSWNYDGNDDGVSQQDWFFLLARGEKVAGESMAIEINGGDATNWGHEFPINDIYGNTIGFGNRYGANVTYRLWNSYSSTERQGKNVVFWIHPRYGYQDGIINLSNGAAGVLSLGYDIVTQCWYTFSAVSNQAIHGTVSYNIYSLF